MALTQVAINNAKAQDKVYRLYDEKGLYLEVTPPGDLSPDIRAMTMMRFPANLAQWRFHP